MDRFGLFERFNCAISTCELWSPHVPPLPSNAAGGRSYLIRIHMYKGKERDFVMITAHTHASPIILAITNDRNLTLGLPFPFSLHSPCSSYRSLRASR